MSDSIIVIFETLNLTKTGNKVAQTVEGHKYYIGKDKQISFPLHTPVKILISTTVKEGKKFNWINWAGSVAAADVHTPKQISAPMPPRTIENTAIMPSKPAVTSKYTEEDRKAFEANKEQMRQSTALNNSVTMTDIVFRNKTNEDKTTILERAKQVKEVQNMFYKDYYKLLGGGDKASQSGIEVAEEVTSEEYNSGELMD